MPKLKGVIFVALALVSLGISQAAIAKTVEGILISRGSEELSANINFKSDDSTVASSTKKSIIKKILIAKQKAEASEKNKIAALKVLKKSSKESKEDAQQIVASLKDINDQLKKDFDTNLSLTQKESDSVQYAEPDYLFQMDSAYFPNDLNFDSQWYLRSILGQNSSIFSTQATLNRPVIVAVIDSGVDYTHEDLQQSMWSSASCVDASGTAIAGGCTNGYDFLDSDKDPSPSDGSSHGTAVASLVGAVTDNGKGISSVSQNRVKIMALRVADNSGFVSLSAAVNAIYFAVNNGADIINISFSGPTYSQSLYDAISFAQTHGVAVVVSAGNNYGQNIDTNPTYPASYSLSNIIPVSATDRTGALASFSNYGPNTVKVAAPGSQIYAAAPGNTYTTMSGTSFSAPIITAYLARGISEGNTATGTLSAIPTYAPMSYFVINGRELGIAVSSSTSSDLNPFVRLPSGSILDIFAKGGNVLGTTTGFTLDYSKGYSLKDPKISTWAFQNSPGSSILNLTAPFTNAPTISGSSGTLSWQSVNFSGAKYGAYLSKYNPSSDTTSSIFQHENLTGTSDSFSSLSPGIYFWNTAVSSSNTLSSAINLTPVFAFQVAPTQSPPANAPTGVTPVLSSAPGYSNSNSSLSLSWNSVSSATYYYVAWRDYSLNAAYDSSGSNPTGTSYTISNLTASHYYYVTIAACNSSGCSGSSSYYYFYRPQTNNTPSVPTISGSSSGTTGIGYNLTFNSTDADTSDVLTYTTNWGDGQSQTSSTYSPGVNVSASHAYSSSGTYCIQVSASDGKSSSSYSSCKYVIVSSAATSPDIIPVAISLGVSGASPGASLPITFSLKNNGTSNITSSFSVSFYIAPQSSGASTQYSFCTYTWSSSISAGSTQTASTTCTLPSSSSGAYGSAGYYNIVMFPDSSNAISEGTAGENNNISNQAGVGYSSLIINSVASSGGTTQSISLSSIGTTQTAGTPFSVTISSQGLASNAKVSLSADGGVNPGAVTLSSGSWTGNVTFVSSGIKTLTASAAGINSISNPILVNPSSGSFTNGNISIWIKDSPGITPLSNVTITATFLNSCCTAQTWTGTTDSQGKVLIPSYLIPVSATQNTKIALNASFVDGLGNQRNETLDPISYSSLTTSVNRNIPSNVDNTNTPVIFLPGIMGSTNKNKVINVSSSLPKEMPAPADQLKVNDAWFTIGWTNLKNKFILNGYQDGKTIIECPYDWRIPILKEANYYLDDCIKQALAKNPLATKVDIIAHSQGGLVTRAYIQENNAANASKVRKIAFVGTPQNGSSEAYLTWEGGDLDDPNNGPSITTARNIYNAMTGKYLGLGISSFFNGHMINSAGYDQNILRDFIHSNVWAIKQLLPTYAFLATSTNSTPQKISLTSNDNEFLHALNSENCLDGTCDDSLITNTGTYSFSSYATAAQYIQTKVFYNNQTPNSTLQNIVTKTSNVAGLYEDGMPVTKLKDMGDGTVPALSIDKFTNSNQIATSSTNADHPHLIEQTKDSLVQFIVGAGAKLSSVIDANTPELDISATGPVVASITDPNGNSIGVLSNGTSTSAIVGATANIQGGSNVFIVHNPINGIYQLSITGPDASDVSIEVVYKTDIQTTPQTFKVFHNSGTLTIPLTITQ